VSLLVHFGCTLKETRVKVEDISRVGLTAWGTTEEQRHLAVGDSLLREIVIDDERVLSTVTEEFSHRSASEWGKVLQRSSLRGGGSDDHTILHSIVLLKSLDELSNSGALLANGDVDTVELLLLVVGVVPSLLVENGVEGNSGLASLTITNDQLTLATANRHHGVDGLETSLHGLVDGLTRQDTGGLELSTALLSSLDGALAVDGVAESVDDTAEKLRADRDINNFTGTLDDLTLLDETIGTEQHNTDLAGLEVHAHALDARGELDQLLSLDIGHAVHTGNTITNGEDTAGLSKTRLLLNTSNALLEDRRDLSRGCLGVGGVETGSAVHGGGCGISGSSDSAGGRDSADSAGGLANSVAEHIRGGI